jgi:hypothetical protein
VNRQADLLEMILTGHPGRGLANFLNGRQQKPDQNRDNRNDDQQLNQSKTLPTRQTLADELSHNTPPDNESRTMG